MEITFSVIVPQEMAEKRELKYSMCSKIREKIFSMKIDFPHLELESEIYNVQNAAQRWIRQNRNMALA